MAQLSVLAELYKMAQLCMMAQISMVMAGQMNSMMIQLFLKRGYLMVELAEQLGWLSYLC